jgi:thiamine kinase-like enzyme
VPEPQTLKTGIVFGEAPRGEVRPLHGASHPGNLVAVRGGGIVWIDFEDVCLGPVEWDLATIMDEGPSQSTTTPRRWPDARNCVLFRLSSLCSPSATISATWKAGTRVSGAC